MVSKLTKECKYMHGSSSFYTVIVSCHKFNSRLMFWCSRFLLILSGGIESFCIVWAGVGGFELKGSWHSCGSGRIGPARDSPLGYFITKFSSCPKKISVYIGCLYARHEDPHMVRHD